MLFKDLRDFLGILKEKGQFVEVKKEMESGYEVSVLGWEFSECGGGLVIKFKIKGYDMLVVVNV